MFVTAGQTASDKYREIGHAIRYGISVAVAMSWRQINILFKRIRSSHSTNTIIQKHGMQNFRTDLVPDINRLSCRKAITAACQFPPRFNPQRFKCIDEAKESIIIMEKERMLATNNDYNLPKNKTLNHSQ